MSLTRLRKLPRLLALALLVASLLAACAGRGGGSRLPSADAQIAALVAGLHSGDLSGVQFSGDAAAAVAEYKTVTTDLDGYLPSVQAGKVQVNAKAGTGQVELTHTYTFGKDAAWSFTSPVQLSFSNGSWQVNWSPTIVNPQLSGLTRLVHSRQVATRGNINDLAGTPIVTERPIYRVGIDKTKVGPDQWDSSARALAALVKVDADPFAAQVKAAGPQAFVAAIVLRAGQVPVGWDAIPGVIAQPGSLPLAPTSSFARSLLGTVGEATAEDIAKAGDTIVAGDLVGHSGLQRSFDAQLRGEPGHTVTMVSRRRGTETLPSTPASGSSAGAANTPSFGSTGSGLTGSGAGSTKSGAPASATSTSSPGDSQSPLTDTKQILFQVAPVNGTALKISLNADLQAKAEALLAKQTNVSTIVVLDNATGGIVAAATSPAAGANDFALTGQYAPGSTFKISTSLALIRQQGLNADSTVNCPPTITVNGKTFKNHGAYPSSATGAVPLHTALENSCNTLFAASATSFKPGELASAAASLGIGKDYDIGFASFFGSVPSSDDPATQAADTIGQGEVVASPMAMAAEAASVAAGHTVVPWLVSGKQPTSTATPLTASEADVLRDLMHAVVYNGPLLPSLRGVLDGGKSGTAEFDTSAGLSAHQWVIGYTGTYSIATMVFDQTPGNATATQLTQLMLK